MQYRRIRRSAECEYWRRKILDEVDTPRQMWRTLDTIRGKGRVTASAPISEQQFHAFFDEKIATVRRSTSGANPPTFTLAVPECQFHEFADMTAAEVIRGVLTLLNQQCATDPIPTSFLKDHVGILAPFLVHLFNRSLSAGYLPHAFNSAYVTPLLKKADLDATDVKSYRPISNLSVLSKLLERLVAGQLRMHIDRCSLIPETQSAYRRHHSIETAVLRVHSDLLQAVDEGDVGVLVLLDLSAAFNTVDYATLLNRLSESCGIGGRALS